MLKQQLNRKYKATSTYVIILVLNFMGFSTILSNLFGIVGKELFNQDFILILFAKNQR